MYGRIVDTSLGLKLGSMKNPTNGLMAGVYWGVIGADRLLQSNLASIARLFLARLLAVLHLVVLWVILCPLAIINVCGITISGGISLWRLIERDYQDGQAPNMEPAIVTLYYLAVLQGVVHCYIVFFIHIRRRMVKAVAVECSDREMDVLTKYLKETMFQCTNDPSLVTQRNLITQAVDKITSRSVVDCVSGVEILYTAISIVERKVKHCIKESYLFNEDDGILVFHSMMMKHLILSASSAHILQKLLEMLDSRVLHAMIVDRLALDIDLEQFPRGIQHISSLLGMFQPYHRDCLHDEFEQCCAEDYGAYEKLLLQGLSIFRKLATDRNNCRVMSDTPDLVSNIMVPITSDLLHNTPDDHGAWSDVVMKSLEVMSQLVVAPGEIGAKLRREISRSKEVVSTLQRILSCSKCKQELQQRAIQILTRIHMDSECNRREFVSTLVDVFTQDTKYISATAIKGYAGCALSEICFHGGIGDAKTVIQIGGGKTIHEIVYKQVPKLSYNGCALLEIFKTSFGNWKNEIIYRTILMNTEFMS